MNETHGQLTWLRRGLVTWVGLMAVTVTSGLIWVLLASLGDHVGTRAFRVVTWGTGIASGVCGISLLIGTVRSLIQLMERQDGETK